MRSMGSAAVRDERSFQTSIEFRSRQAGITGWLDAHPVRAFAALTVVCFVCYLRAIFVEADVARRVHHITSGSPEQLA